MTNDADEYIKIKKSELDELKSKIEEQEIVIEHARGYAFGLESKNVRYLNRIKELKDDIEEYETSASWKITKPLRSIMNLFK
ncbi:hypothetical protein [Methanobrevibacter sp.]|uniref:hypothetical protein n=1 Tax=Methanobrevibacter sp. TaxID=66852 RepID=UPI0038911A08